MSIKYPTTSLNTTVGIRRLFRRIEAKDEHLAKRLRRNLEARDGHGASRSTKPPPSEAQERSQSKPQ